jgi:hypothetical protein
MTQKSVNSGYWQMAPLSRHQIVWIETSIDDRIPDDHPVRLLFDEICEAVSAIAGELPRSIAVSLPGCIIFHQTTFRSTRPAITDSTIPQLHGTDSGRRSMASLNNEGPKKWRIQFMDVVDNRAQTADTFFWPDKEAG